MIHLQDIPKVTPTALLVKTPAPMPALACEPSLHNCSLRAWSLNLPLDELPLKQAHLVCLRVMNCFSCESLYYHSRKGSRLISPQEQQSILNVFRSTGLGITPKFDGFQYIIEW